MADPVALQAIRDALDRAGLNPKTAVELDVALKPYERMLENMPRLQGGSRAQWRRSQGIPDDSDAAAIQSAKAALANADAPVDIEIVDNKDGPASDTVDQQTFTHPDDTRRSQLARQGGARRRSVEPVRSLTGK